MGGLRVIAVVMIVGCGARTALRIDGSVADAGPDAALDDGAVEMGCAPPATLYAARADLALVLDRSGSMMNPLAASTEPRWTALGSALASTLPSIDSTVAVGAIYFPVFDPSGSMDSICVSASALDVPIALGSSHDVLAAFGAHGPQGGTPTADALTVAVGALRGRSGVGVTQSIVLATDGGPNCNPADASEPWYGVDAEECAMVGVDPHACLDAARTVGVIAAALSAGVPTYVIGMSVTFPLLVDTLNQMAAAGGRPRAGASSFYDVERPDDLLAAFAEIAARAMSCSFTSAAPVDLAAGTVTIDGAPVDRGGADGWAAGSSGTIDLAGASCVRAQRPGALVQFVTTCP